MSTTTDAPTTTEQAPATPKQRARKPTAAKSTTTRKPATAKKAPAPRNRGKDTMETRTTKVIRINKTTLARIDEVGRQTRRRGIDAVDYLIDLGLKSLGEPGLPLPGDDAPTTDA